MAISKSRIVRWFVAALFGVLGLACVVVALLTARVKVPGEETLPAGLRRNTSTYLRMHDGVEIAVDIWLPAGLKRGERVPVLMRATRYWRAVQHGWAYKPMLAVGVIQAPAFSPVDHFNRRGYAVLLVDGRGSGASGGKRDSETSPQEIADYGEVAHWAAQQPWSNGNVGAFGVSYEGNTAELIAGTGESAIKAVAPLFNDFDPVMLVLPNGVYAHDFLQPWSDMVWALDHNDICALQQMRGVRCWWLRQMTPGVKLVDADPKGEHLRELLNQRRATSVASALGSVEFRDDPVGNSGGTPLHFSDMSGYGQQSKLESGGVPMQVWCGWLDAATCEGALERFATFSNPQQVIIGPCSHGCRYNIDPFLPAEKHIPSAPTLPEQWKMRAEFFDRHLKSNSLEKEESTVQYYTMGEGKWHVTPVWPPAYVAHSSRRYYFSAAHTLSTRPPEAEGRSDTYTVDFTASTGQNTRWHTQMGGSDVWYPDRREEDKKLLVYTSEPLETDAEITGSPVINLELASNMSDGAVHAYLEDVGPDGRVTYLDEGMFRIMHRKIANPAAMPFTVFGPAHSLLRADAQPLVPGEPATISFNLFPTSLLLRKGHRVRVALAGADAPLFRRYPPQGTPVWTVYREKARASFIDLPLRPL